MVARGWLASDGRAIIGVSRRAALLLASVSTICLSVVSSNPVRAVSRVAQSVISARHNTIGEREL